MTPEELSQHTHDGMMKCALSSVAAIFEGDGWSPCDALRAANGLMEPAFRAWGELIERVMADDKRIRELEAEIAVRDNMGNEVLRILREATGRRDFHSEMEAAEWAAKMLAEARRDGARKQFLCEQGCYMAHDKDGETCWLIWPYGKDGDGQPETQSGMYDLHNAAIDAAMEAK